jgi:hypothetical protein
MLLVFYLGVVVVGDVVGWLVLGNLCWELTKVVVVLYCCSETSPLTTVVL